MIKWMFALMTVPAGATCVSDLNYPAQLQLPHLERWAQDTVFGLPSAELECTMVQKLMGLFDDLEKRTAAEPPLHRRLRGTHSKGTCVAGTFRPRFDSRLNEARRALLRTAEIFASSDARPTHARFANGASHVQPDWAKDVRALSFKVDLGGGGTQDFSFNNVARFQIDSLDTFNLVMEMTKGVLSGQIEKTDDGPSVTSLFAYFQRQYGTLAAGRDLFTLNRVKKMAEKDTGWHDSYLTQTYWSTTAFALGDTNRDVGELPRVVKFGASPCNDKSTKFTSEVEAKNASRLKGLERPNYLGDDLRQSIARTPACFKVFVEFLDQEKSVIDTPARASQLVENPSIAWKAPAYTVGELAFERAVDPAVCDDPAHAINVLQNQSGIVGVGQINRARQFVEGASQRAR